MLCPGNAESMSEIGYMLLGRSSIFWISFIIMANSFGLNIVFFNVFGETTKSVIKMIFVNPPCIM